MRLAMFSDLHLATPDTNRCELHPHDMLRLLDRLESETGRVVTVGDLLDLSRPRVPGGWRAHLEAIKKAWPSLTSRLLGFDGVYGNHDAARAHQGMPERLTFLTQVGPVLLTHGHQADGGLKRIPGLAQAANYVAGWMVRGRLDVGADLLEDVPRQFDRLRGMGRARPRSGPADPTSAWARELVEMQGGVVVMGHIHLPRLVAGRRGLYINTGAMAQGQASYVILDTDQGEVELWSHGACVARADFDGVRWRLHGTQPYVWTWE